MPALMSLCALSTMLDLGLYAGVAVLDIPNNSHHFLKRSESNCLPLSEWNCDGIPNLEMTWVNNSFATLSADVSLMGIASIHLVKQHRVVRICVFPFADGFNGPTKSMDTLSHG